MKAARQLDKRDQRLLALRAADRAEEVLRLFEEKHPHDDRPRKAIAAARARARGEIRCNELCNELGVRAYYRHKSAPRAGGRTLRLTLESTGIGEGRLTRGRILSFHIHKRNGAGELTSSASRRDVATTA